jgi:hypothetical protein
MSIPPPLNLQKDPFSKFTDEMFEYSCAGLRDDQKDQILAWQGPRGLGPFDEENRLRAGLDILLKMYQEKHLDIFTVVIVWTDSLVSSMIKDWNESGRNLVGWMETLE